MKAFSETAAATLKSTLRAVERELRDDIQKIDELIVIFSWEGKDFQIRIGPYLGDIIPTKKKPSQPRKSATRTDRKDASRRGTIKN